MEQYCKVVNLEANLVLKLGRTLIFPAAIRYQSELATTCASLKAVGYTFDTNTLDQITVLVKELQDSLFDLEKAGAHNGDSTEEEARHCCESLVPKMLAVRKAAEQLQGMG